MNSPLYFTLMLTPQSTLWLTPSNTQFDDVINGTSAGGCIQGVCTAQYPK